MNYQTSHEYPVFIRGENQRDRGDKTACSHHFDDKHSFIAYAKATFTRWAYLFNEQTGEWNTIDINKEDESDAVG